MSNLKRIVMGLVFCGFSFLSTQAFAATITWTGATDNNWSTPGNWSGSAVPTSSD